MIRNLSFFTFTIVVTTAWFLFSKDQDLNGDDRDSNQQQAKSINFALEENSLSGSRRAEIESKVAEYYQKLLKEYPLLNAAIEDVKPEENGYYQLWKFRKEYPDGFLTTIEIRNVVSGDEKSWNTGLFRQWLKENKELFQRIQKIANLEKSSISEVPVSDRLYGSRVSSEMSKVLVAYARLQKEAGDMSSAINSYSQAQNLSSHFRNIEQPTVLDITMYHTLDANWKKSVFNERSLEEVWRANALGELRGLFEKDEPRNALLRKFLIGEWSYVSQQMLIPAKYSSSNDPEALSGALDKEEIDDLIHSHAAMYSDAVELLDDSNLEQKMELENLFVIPTSNEKVRSILDSTAMSESWIQAYYRINALNHFKWSALKFMETGELEKSPYAQESYHWDTEKRTFSAPDSIKENFKGEWDVQLEFPFEKS